MLPLNITQKLKSIKTAWPLNKRSCTCSALSPQSAEHIMPNKPINFIIMAGKGGGADKMERLMQGIIEKENFSNRPLVPVNKSGASGASQISH